jgi:hypothetical protein
MPNYPAKNLAAALTLCSVVTMMTTLSHGQILIGPTAGVQMSWINFEDKGYKDLYSSKPGFGYHAGASVSFRMLKKVFLQGSVLYSQKSKNLVGKLDREFQNKARFNYIEIPISFTKEVKMHFGENKYYNLYFGVGPTISYWLGGKGTLSASDLNENVINPPSYDINYKITFRDDPEEIPLGEMNVSDANRLLLGLNFSAGLVLEPNKINKFMVTMRYDLGHSFFSQSTDGSYGLDGTLFYDDDMQSRHQGVAFSVYYFIDLKTEEKNRGRSTSKIKRS